MSKKTDQFEEDITNFLTKSIGLRLPEVLPIWMVELGIIPNSKILGATRVGSSGSKTDISIQLENSAPIKISVKLSSADYFGNWYSHTRIVNEFGINAFNNLSSAITNHANNIWKNKTDKIFVGVSVCFGKRSGDTSLDFNAIFDSIADMRKIISGDNPLEPGSANCLYISNNIPLKLEDFLSNLSPINDETMLALSSNFKIIFRPINPLTERTNRGKCVYTTFKPYKKLDTPTTVTNIRDLNELGTYVCVHPDSLNHNRILTDLEENWNIIIPRKK